MSSSIGSVPYQKQGKRVDSECNPVAHGCSADLAQYSYILKNGLPLPKFSVPRFRRQMAHKRIMLIGPSMMRQQHLALAMALDGKPLLEELHIPTDEGMLGPKNCTKHNKGRPWTWGVTCFNDAVANITVCHQILQSFATQVYTRGKFTLDHSRRGGGDTSCILTPKSLKAFVEFDLVLVQSLAWWTNIPKILDSPTSPKHWVAAMLPTVYRDAMTALLGSLSTHTKTVLVLGQTGTLGCDSASEPVPQTQTPAKNTTQFELQVHPGMQDQYDWGAAKILWDTAIALVQDNELDVQIVDVRGPLMAAANAHPTKDCLHFCMNSAALNVYLDYYQAEVFS